MFQEVREPDLSAIKEIYDWYVANSTATFHTEPIQLEQLREFIYIGHPLYKSYLIYSDGLLAGYCILTDHKKRQAYNRTAEITIYLKPSFCNQGIGRVSLHYLEEVAQSLGLKNLIGVITGDNAGSIRLFEKAGYSKCAHFRNIGEKFGKLLDVVAYQKELTNSNP